MLHITIKIHTYYTYHQAQSKRRKSIIFTKQIDLTPTLFKNRNLSQHTNAASQVGL